MSSRTTKISATPLVRDYGRVLELAKSEAREMASKFFYSDGDSEYLTFHSAMLLVRLWGHCKVETVIVAEGETSWTIAARFTDLLEGFEVSRVYRQSKQENLEDALSSGQSKAIRKVIEISLPERFIQGCITEAKSAEPLASAQRGDNLFASL